MKDDAQPPGLSAAWPPFESKLTEVLAVLEEDHFLVISSKRGWAYVQFASYGSFGLRAEAVSNNYLPNPNALTQDQVDGLHALGWVSPTGTPEEAMQQPDGSPNFFRQYSRPVPFADVARLAVRTLSEIMGISHPRHLDYQAFDRNHRAILFPSLGLMVRPGPPPQPTVPTDSVEQIREAILPALREVSGVSDLEFDDEGQLAVRFGTAVVVLRVRRAPACVSITSPILANIEATDELVDRINDLNGRVRFARLFVLDGTVYGAVEVPGSPLIVEHVIRACAQLGRLADGVDGMLQRQFGGRTAFGEFRTKSSSVH